VHTHVPRGWAVQNETSHRKWAQKTQTNTELPIRCLHMSVDGPGHQLHPRCNIWSWQMWERCHAHANATGLGRDKRYQSRKMGPENTNKYRTPHPLPAHVSLMVQDIKYNPGALSGLGRYGKGHVYMHVLQGWAVQNVTSLRKWAKKTQTNTDLPIRCLHMPADSPGHQIHPRYNIWSWQMLKGCHAHACAAGLGREERDQSQNMCPENTNKYRTPHLMPAHAC